MSDSGPGLRLSRRGSRAEGESRSQRAKQMPVSNHSRLGKAARVSIGLHDNGSRIGIISTNQATADFGLGYVRNVAVDDTRILRQKFFVLIRHHREIHM